MILIISETKDITTDRVIDDVYENSNCAKIMGSIYQKDMIGDEFNYANIFIKGDSESIVVAPESGKIKSYGSWHIWFD